MTKHNWIKNIAIILTISAGILNFTSLIPHASNVNNYIYSHGLFNHHAPITYQRSAKLHAAGHFHAGTPNGVVVHETANEHSNIYGEIRYMKAHYKDAFVHSFVDDNAIINITNYSYRCWGAGPAANARFLQFEQTRMHSQYTFAKQVNNAAWYTAYLLHLEGETPSNACINGNGTVWSHAAVSRFLGWTDHTDPNAYWSNRGKAYFDQGYDMNQFFELVNNYYWQPEAWPNPMYKGNYGKAKKKKGKKRVNYYVTKKTRFRLYRRHTMKGIKRRYKHRINVRILNKVMKNGKKRGWHVQLQGRKLKGYLKAGVHLRHI